TDVWQVDPATAAKTPSIACYPGGEHSIEHVDATGDRLDQVGGRADPYQVAGTVGREDGCLHRQQPVGQRFRFTETQAADAESVKCEAAKEFRTLPPKAFIDSTLDDPK